MSKLYTVYHILLYNMKTVLWAVPTGCHKFFFVVSRYIAIKFNSLHPSDTIWHQVKWSWSILDQVMACCLTASSHSMNQFWFTINEVPCHLVEGSFTENVQYIIHCRVFEDDIFYWFVSNGQCVNEYSINICRVLGMLCSVSARLFLLDRFDMYFTGTGGMVAYGVWRNWTVLSRL